MRILVPVFAAFALAPLAAFAGPTPAPAGAEAYIISPKDGATVASPVTVQFGLKGMGVAPAGVAHDKTGHFHLLVDVDPKSVDTSTAIPSDDHHHHYGGGQTQATVDLTPGKHTMFLLMGDASHVPLSPSVMSKPISITVK